ncbi:thioredoxin family protein [Tenacibaculum tangerinum]|uniref:Thioredoxin family protein n=1 Tax=Tenacibaculum tangerinum TaxID=3038772 RepID=A0ABY8L6H6_9FLAO|nr:thioredoxin family protein [Tenacibaculum tangerinum]WGH75978.1 thioredoxin family protein [Tenacibaculum tangerinum]
MRNLYIHIVLILGISLFSCNSRDKKVKSDLNLYIESTMTVDSIYFSNFTQNREQQYLSYTNPLYVTLKDSINDLYLIDFYTDKGVIMSNNMWLNGKNIVIKGSLSNKSLKIDTVIGSDLYYKYKNYKSRYENLLKKHPKDSTKINSFLIEELNKNIDNLLSIDISEMFMRRNLNKKNELVKIYQLLSSQNDMLKNHLLSPYAKIENLLSADKIDFSEYLFYNKEKSLSQIEFPNSELYLIDFWFLGCPPCIEDHKIIKNKLEWLRSNNIELIGISIDTDQENWKDYLNKENYSWINYREQENPNKSISKKLFIYTFPTYLLIDKDGKVLVRSNSFSEMEKLITKHNSP